MNDKTTVRTTGTRVRWQEFSGWTAWMDCWRADIEDDCLRIVTKNTYVQWSDADSDSPFIGDDGTEFDDEITIVPLHNVRGRIEIRNSTQEDE